MGYCRNYYSLIFFFHFFWGEGPEGGREWEENVAVLLYILFFLFLMDTWNVIGP